MEPLVAPTLTNKNITQHLHFLSASPERPKQRERLRERGLWVFSAKHKIEIYNFSDKFWIFFLEIFCFWHYFFRYKSREWKNERESPAEYSGSWRNSGLPGRVDSYELRLLRHHRRLRCFHTTFASFSNFTAGNFLFSTFTFKISRYFINIYIYIYFKKQNLIFVLALYLFVWFLEITCWNIQFFLSIALDFFFLNIYFFINFFSKFCLKWVL